MPVFIISGTDCALGGFKKGVTKVYNSFLEAGLSDVEFKLYKDARHELINELNKSEVFEDIIVWLNKKLKLKTHTGSWLSQHDSEVL